MILEDELNETLLRRGEDARGEGRREGREEEARKRYLALVLRGAFPEGVLFGEDLPPDEAEGVDVSLLTVGVGVRLGDETLAEDLGGRVLDVAAEAVVDLTLVVLNGEAKVTGRRGRERAGEENGETRRREERRADVILTDQSSVTSKLSSLRSRWTILCEPSQLRPWATSWQMRIRLEMEVISSRTFLRSPLGRA